MPDGVEFVGASGTEAGADEELSPGPRRPLPRWVMAAAVVVVLAAIVTVIATQHSAPHPRAAASTAPSVRTTGGTATPRPHPPGTTAAGTPSQNALPLDSAAPVLGLAIDGASTWVLQKGRLLGFRGRSEEFSVSFIPAYGGPARLAVDPARNLVWAVFTGAGASHIMSFPGLSARGPAAAPTAVDVPGPVSRIAALDGSLYLAAGSRIEKLTSGDRALRPVVVPARATVVTALVADPRRHRLYAAGTSTAVPGVSSVWAIDPVRRRVLATGPGAGSAPQLALSGSGQLWTSGFQGISRLDPVTMLATRTVSTGYLGVDVADLVAAGSRVLWVRDGTTPRLRCVSAADGSFEQFFTAPGLVASSSGVAASPRTAQALIASRSSVQRLTLAGCAG